MKAEAVFTIESPEQIEQNEQKKQKVMSFIDGMKAIKFDGPRGKFDLDTFILLTYDQRTKADEIEFISWAEDSSRINPGYLEFLLNSLKLPEKKDHAPYPPTDDLQYYQNNMPHEGKKIPVIAFGTGGKGRTILYRRTGMSTKISFERLQKAVRLELI